MMTFRKPVAGYSALNKGGSFLSGFIKGEPLLEVARSGLARIGVSEIDQDRYVERIVKHGSVEDAISMLELGTVTSDLSQEMLVARSLGKIGPLQATRLIVEGHITSEKAQESLLADLDLRPELAFALLKSGKVRSENGQRILAQSLFSDSMESEGIFRQISGRIAHKLLSEGKVTFGIAQEMLSAIIANSAQTENDSRIRAASLLSEGKQSEAAQDLLSLVVFDPDVAKLLLSLGTVTSKIARSRLYEKIPEGERDTILDGSQLAK